MKKHYVRNNVKYIFVNFKYYLTFYFGAISFIGVIIAIASCIINVSDLLNEWSIAQKIGLIVGVYFGIAFLIIPFFFWKRRLIYYKNGEHEVSAEYGDLNKLSYKYGSEKVVFINVNTTFDMIIEPPGPKALVAEGTNHGRFIKRVCDANKLTFEQLNSDVQKLLDNQTKFTPRTVKREKGNEKDYPIGTYVIYKLGKISYLLFAFARFNENNNAYPGEESKDELPLKELLTAVNESSQNLDVYIPLLGTGNSRYHFSNYDSFNQIKHYLLSHKRNIEAKYRIVVYSGIKDEVSIFKNT